MDRSSYTSGSDDGDTRTTVINQALDILYRIHTAFVTPAESQSETQQAASSQGNADLEDAKRRRILHALLDLISLEGIYPSLSSGVGIPLQQRVISVLPAGVIAKQAHAPASSIPHNEDLLRHVMTVLLDIVLDSRPSIQPVIRGRILSDIISGAADLAFNPNISSTLDQTKFQDGFAEVIDQYVSISYGILKSADIFQDCERSVAAHAFQLSAVRYYTLVQSCHFKPNLSCATSPGWCLANDNVYRLAIRSITGTRSPERTICRPTFYSASYYADLATSFLRAAGR